MVGYNYKIKDLDGETLTDRACHCCGELLTVAETEDPDAWEDEGCYCDACREADEQDHDDEGDE